jgi:hypothetical protein
MVTSFKSKDIKVQATSPPGAVALKNYLQFARSGRLDSGPPLEAPPIARSKPKWRNSSPNSGTGSKPKSALPDS